MKRTIAAIGFLVFALVILLVSTVGHVSAQDDVTICRGQTITISTRLLQNGTFGDPVPYQEVEFFDERLNTLIGIRLTDSDGYASIDWTPSPTYPLGTTLLNITFRGDEPLFLYPSAEWITVIVLASTTIEITFDKTTLAPGDVLRATAILLDNLGTPLGNQAVSLLHGDDIMASSMTDEDGSAIFAVVCNESWCTVGTNDLQFVFNGNHDSFYDNTVTSASILIQRISTSILSLSQLPDSVQLGQALNLSISLQPALSTELHTYFDGLSYATLPTDSSGTAAIILPVGEGVTLGLHEITIEYPGTQRYESSSLRIQFVVTSSLLAETETPVFPVAGSTVNFTITLRDILYQPVLQGCVIIENTRSGFVYSGDVDNQSGDVRIPVVLDYLKGTTLFSFILSGNPYVTNCSWTAEIVVWSMPSVDLVESTIMGYASPGQEVKLTFHIYDYESNYTGRTTILAEPNGLNHESVTDEYGIVHFVFSAPLPEGSYYISVNTTSDSAACILSATRSFPIIISQVMPLQVSLQYCITRPALQEIHVAILLCALNGSLAEGMRFHYHWLNAQGEVVSSSNGLVEMHLPVPAEPGVHSLLYDIPSSRLVLGTTGELIILVVLDDALASQGIGVAGATFGFSLSAVVGLLPIIRRRHISS